MSECVLKVFLSGVMMFLVLHVVSAVGYVLPWSMLSCYNV